MTKHKYTDEEVIRALEHCANSNTTEYYCNDCPYETAEYCASHLSKDTLALINRQRAEIKMLTENSISAKYPNRVLCSKGVILTKSLEEYDKLIGDISAEAIKEFAERLKCKMQDLARLDNGGTVLFIVGEKFIDELVKEFTEGG